MTDPRDSELVEVCRLIDQVTNDALTAGYDVTVIAKALAQKNAEILAFFIKDSDQRLDLMLKTARMLHSRYRD